MAILAAVLTLLTSVQDPVPRLKYPELRLAQRHRVKGHLKKLPEAVTALDGKWVSAGGYAFLRHEGETIREILLTENMFSPRGVGALPSPFDSIKVSFRAGAIPAGLSQGRFMIVSGRFLVRKEGRLEEEGEQLTALFHVVEAVEGENPDPSRPTDRAIEIAGVNKITFQPLENTKAISQGSDIRVPEDVRALDGRWVTLTGNLLVPWAESEVTRFVLAKNPWDGCCLGIPPGPYDSVAVELRTGTKLADRYSSVQTISGRFKVQLERSEGYVTGLYKLVDAVEGAIPSTDTAEAGGSLALLGGAAAGVILLAIFGFRLLFRSAGGGP